MTEQEVRDAILQAQDKAEQGDVISQHFLGISYLGLKDYVMAAKWFEKAAEQGYADAQMRLGLQFYTGQGVQEDKIKGLEWIRKAAEQGNEKAKNELIKLTAAEKSAEATTANMENEDDILKIAAFYNKAHEFLKKNDHENAIKIYDEFIKLYPNHAAAYFSRAIAHSDLRYNKSGSWYKSYYFDKMITDLEKAVELDPDNTEYCERLTKEYGFDIKNSEFKKYSGLGFKVTIPSNVTSIGAGAFKGKSELEEVIIPSSVTSIGESAFEDCRELKEVIIPSSVTNIGNSAFNGCTHIKSITIPSSVASIGESAFFSCFRLNSVTISPGVTSIGDSAFYGCGELVSINIPSSITSIGPMAFHGCKKLDKASKTTIHKRFGSKPFSGNRCYIATAVYGSYDCPQVWTLRRYRDFKLSKSLYGRAFIQIYYAISPSMVSWFGKKIWFNNFWRFILDHKINTLQKHGFENTPYGD